MSWNDDLLEQVQVDLHARLNNEPFFDDIPILLQRKGDIQSDVETALSSLNSKAGKMGVCVVVLMPEVESPEVELPGPTLEIVQSFQVIERPLFNLDTASGGTGKSAERVALNIVNLVHRYIPRHIGGVVVADRRPVRPNTSADGVISYLAVCRLRSGIDRVSQVLEPTIAQEEGLLSLSSGTSGASIYYTVDGSYPGPANEDATLYDAPFPVAEMTLRVVAYKTDLIPSNSVEAVIIETP